MHMGWVLFICLIVYMSVGVIWYLAEMWRAWYRGDHILGEDLLNIPLAALLWPGVILDRIHTWWHNRCMRANQSVKFKQRVIIPGRLSARVERALKE